MLPAIVAEAVDCPEEPWVGPPAKGDIEIRLHRKGPLDVGTELRRRSEDQAVPEPCRRRASTRRSHTRSSLVDRRPGRPRRLAGPLRRRLVADTMIPAVVRKTLARR